MTDGLPFITFQPATTRFERQALAALLPSHDRYAAALQRAPHANAHIIVLGRLQPSNTVIPSGVPGGRYPNES